MGRGRAKAKQTKVARELKYNVPQTDLDALAAELRANGGTEPAGEADRDVEESSDGFDDDTYRR